MSQAPRLALLRLLGPNYDWIPDQDHGGVLMRTLQTMQMETDGRTNHLLPAGPDGSEVELRLHAPYRTTVPAGRLEAGRLFELEVAPESRGEDALVS